MDYKILYERRPETLQAGVTQYIKMGWVLQGGVAVNDNMWAQAMVKPATETDNC